MPPLSDDRLRHLADDATIRRHVREAYPDVVAAGALDRRMLLRLVAASLATGALAACDDDAPRGRPLLTQPALPPGTAPGEAITIATTLDCWGRGTGVLATVRDGRAIRIDGNALHPASGDGAATVANQAEIFSLHDPERSRMAIADGKVQSPETGAAILARWRGDLAENRGRGTALLLPATASPSVDRLLARLRATAPALAVHRWSPLTSDTPRRGAEAAFGRALDLVPTVANADAILTVGGDPFAIGPAQLRIAADWAARRRDRTRPPPRLVAVETAPSLAGLRADERIALPPFEIAPFLRAVLVALASGTPPDGAHPAAAGVALALRAAGPRALVLVGPEQPVACHLLAHAIGGRLGSVGTTIRLVEPVGPEGGTGSLALLADGLAAGRIRRLALLGPNPAYDAPGDLDLPRLLSRLDGSLHVGIHRDETGRLCRDHVPMAHALESFGDARAFDGTLSFRQPAQHRLSPCWSIEEALVDLAGGDEAGRAVLERTHGGGPAFLSALEDGVVTGSAAASVPVRLRPDWDPGEPVRPAGGGIAVVFAPDPSLGDGAGAANPWLQELPRPVTKQVWGNAALLGPATAVAHGLSRGDLVTLVVGGRQVAVPAWPLPGHAEGALTLFLGGGRREAGRIGNGVGTDVAPLRSAAEPWLANGTMRKAGARVPLVATQTMFDQGDRPILRSVATADADLDHRPPSVSLYPPGEKGPHRWGMAIDLDSCIGCNACAIACQVENNVPAVGPDEAALGRTMHWLRVDRYELGQQDGPSGFQPVPCMHCEAAPCEVVCPVNATVHSSDGLNDMVYSRCIGTRTCAVNCPYTVRRFNFADPAAVPTATPTDALNPQVTARGRGVMEKCTFCVQRIAEARIAARLEGRSVRDGEIRTACESACPTKAIVFGDLADPESRVSRSQASGRAYALLGHLNTRPRTSYLARIEGSGS